MSSGTLHGLLSASAARDGDRIAVVDGDSEMTYRELDEESTRLAAALAEQGVAPGDRVGLLLEKSIPAVVGLYGVLKAGATYVPLDAQAPTPRLAYIAANAGIRCLVSSGAFADHWREFRERGVPLEVVVVADGDPVAPDGMTTLPWSRLAGFSGAADPDPHADPDSLAYILYTSGSTGEPKGVMLSHRNGLAFVEWAADEVGIRPDDRLSSHAPLHFDLSTFDLFAAASGGATVVLVPTSASVFPVALAQFIRESEITVWYSVPSILTMLVLRGQLDQAPLERLRAVVFAGEVFPIRYLKLLMGLIPQARYLNFYGPTETNVCTWYEVPRGAALAPTLPIGRPIPGVEAFVRLPDGEHAGPAEVGELSIRGPTVMHGYWGDAERTARTLSWERGERVYRTGDLVKYGDDGNLLFLGRRDAQIKTRGYRVELGEIEAALNSLSEVVECAVVAVPDELITNRLVAFVAAPGLSESELVQAARQRLPPYMIPEVRLREDLPKSSTGKIDRAGLQTVAEST